MVTMRRAPATSVSSWTLIFLLVVQTIDSAVEDDAKERLHCTFDFHSECGSDVFGQVECRSATLYYTECPIPGAITVHLIKLHRNFSATPCEFKTTFGYRANMVWVTDGCSGEFFICYDGEAITTRPDPTPVVTRVTGAYVETTANPDPVSTTGVGGVIVRGSNSLPETRKPPVAIYILLTVSITVIVGSGVLIGYIVKRWMQRTRSKLIAEKRLSQAHMRSTDGGAVTITQIQPVTQSKESLWNSKPVNGIEHVTFNKGFEAACSCENSNSTQCSGIDGKQCCQSGRKKVRHVSFTLDDKTTRNPSDSLPDIGKIQHTVNTAVVDENHIINCNINSLEHVNETRDLEHVSKLRKDETAIYAMPSIQYYVVSSSDKTENGGLSSLPLVYNTPISDKKCKTKTRAIVHVQPQQYSQPQNECVEDDRKVDIPQRAAVTVETESHYADPESLVNIVDSVGTFTPSHNSQHSNTNAESPVLNVSQANVSTGAIGHGDTQVIYSTVNKPTRKTGTSSENGTTEHADASRTKQHTHVFEPFCTTDTRVEKEIPQPTDITNKTVRPPIIKPKPPLKPKPTCSLKTTIHVKHDVNTVTECPSTYRNEGLLSECQPDSIYADVY